MAINEEIAARGLRSFWFVEAVPELRRFAALSAEEPQEIAPASLAEAA
jgi:hypothetical protein